MSKKDSINQVYSPTESVSINPQTYKKRNLFQHGTQPKMINEYKDGATNELQQHMKMEASRVTYGGQSEILAVNKTTGGLIPITSYTLNNSQSMITNKDIYGQLPIQGYDSSFHLIQIRAGIWQSLQHNIIALQNSIIALAKVLEKEQGTIISSSHHPLQPIHQSYQNAVLPKPIYDILRGRREKLNTHPQVLSKVYAGWQNPYEGRKWFHQVGTMAASAQAWNSIDLKNGVSQIKAAQSTGWLFNLLTANGPYAQGKDTGKRDYRMEMWGPLGIMSTSRHPQDQNLTKSIPSQIHSLTQYYKYVLSSQRPMVISLKENDSELTKNKMRGVVQPNNSQFNSLKYLQSKFVKVVNLETGEQKQIKPSVHHIFNGFDFLYYPRYGGRLRLFLPKAHLLDPKLFADAIEQEDEKLFRQLLLQGGITQEGGAICIEGRAAATILPTKDHPSWNRFNIPFVLQTGIIRAHEEINQYFKKRKIPWEQLSDRLPEKTNLSSQDGGFNSFVVCIDGTKIEVTILAKKVWEMAKSKLSLQELALVENEIDEIILKRKGPAEEQIDFMKQNTGEDGNLIEGLKKLIQRQHIYLS